MTTDKSNQLPNRQTPHPLPNRVNLSKLKKQAKQLLRRFREGETSSLEFVDAFHPKPGQFKALHDAQLCIARSYGFSGWSELCDAVELSELSALDLTALAGEFIDLACIRYDSDDSERRYNKANRLLAEKPELTQANFISAVIAHNLEYAKNLLTQNPDLAIFKFPPRDWQALQYLCYSRIRDNSDEKIAVKTAKLLLDAGADPNSHFSAENYHFTALTGAIGEGEAGLKNQPPHQYAKELASLLLDAGAHPNDSQALYNTMFSDNGDYWFDTLRSYGLNKTHKVNWNDSDKAEFMFDYLLESSVIFKRLDRAKKLLRLGANPNAKCHYSDRSIYTLSLVKGLKKFSNAMLEAGAEAQTLSPEDQFLIAVLNQDVNSLKKIIPQYKNLLSDPELFENATPTLLQLFIEMGLDVNRQNETGKTALHTMCSHGKLDCVKFLLTQGADPKIRDHYYQANAVGHAHFRNHFKVRDYLLDHYDFVIEASACGRFNRLKEILDKTPSLVKQKGLNGNTALHVVCVWLNPGEQDQHREAIFNLLLDKGADINAQNNDGLTALQFNEKINADENLAILDQLSIFH
jgi:ankyrin repeat protein